MSASRRVLVFAYYFPPMGLSGVQRVAKFVKYLHGTGWTPVVVTAEPRAYFAFDQELRRELDEMGVAIHATGSADPTRAFGRRRLSFPTERKRQMFARVSSFLFVPDNKKAWQSKAVDRALSLHREHPFDVVYATAPPYTALRAACDFSERTGVPLVSDFRDDWVGNPRHVYPTPIHRRAHSSMETRVIERSSAVTTINPYIARDLIARHDGVASKVTVIRQGFDPDDFALQPAPVEFVTDSTCVFLYCGTFYDAQKPDVFLSGLRLLLNRRPELARVVSAVFVGTYASDVLAKIQTADLSQVVALREYVDHGEVCRMMIAADILWMIIGNQSGAEQLSTGKLYEYLGTRKPVLGLVPAGDAFDTLDSYSAGFTAPPDDVRQCADIIEQLVDLKLAHNLPIASQDEISKYNRRLLTIQLSRVFDAVIDDEARNPRSDRSDSSRS